MSVSESWLNLDQKRFAIKVSKPFEPSVIKETVIRRIVANMHASQASIADISGWFVETAVNRLN